MVKKKYALQHAARHIYKKVSGKRDSNMFSYIFENQRITSEEDVIGCKIGVKITILQLLLERELKGKHAEGEGGKGMC